MIARELISDEIPPLKTTDTGLKALQWMDEFKVGHLPLVRKNEYLGLIADTDILDLEEPEKLLKNFPLKIDRPYVTENAHVYEVMRLSAAMKLSVIPILDEEERYLGLTDIHHLIELLVNTTSIAEAGGVIILEMSENDYALSEIARIVESNDAKILSTYITSVPNSTEIEVTLKVNRKDLSRILQTFYRYEYKVKASYHEDPFSEDLKDRYDSLMNFLNI